MSIMYDVHNKVQVDSVKYGKDTVIHRHGRVGSGVKERDSDLRESGKMNNNKLW